MSEEALIAAADLAYVARLLSERDAARADAAALGQKLSELLNEIDGAELVGCWPERGIVASGWRLDSQAHPGAMLLAELHAARALIAALRAGPLLGQQTALLRDYDAAVRGGTERGD